MAVVYSARFETTADGWAINTGAGSLSTSTEQAYAGSSSSLKVAVSSAGTLGLVSPIINVSQGEVYDITVPFFPGPTLRPTYMQVDYYIDSFTYDSGDAMQYTGADGRTAGVWQADKLPRITIPANVTQMRIIVQQRENAASGDYFYIDEITVESVAASSAAPSVTASAPINSVWQDSITMTASATNTETYAWSVSSAPAGSTALINGASLSSATFIPDKVGAYTFTVSVSGPGGSATASATTTVGAMMWRKTNTGKVPVQIKRNQ